MSILKQSTAATIKLGPFVDDTDGKTAETGLTISQADIRLSKNGGDIAQSHDATGATHDELGYYNVPLDATDTDTLGRLRVAVSKAGALPVWQDFIVVTANVYDSLFSTDKLDCAVVEIATDALTAAAVKADAVTKIQNGLALETTLTAIKGVGWTDETLVAILTAIESASGSGLSPNVYTVTDTTTGLPISGVLVKASTDSAGTNMVAQGVTNSLGQVTLNLDVGVTYYLWRYKFGYEFTNPDVEVAV